MAVYLVDGYNLLFFLTQKQQPLEKDRKELLSFLMQHSGSIAGEIWVIFDGTSYKESSLSSSYLGNIRIEFSPFGMKADEYILEKIYGTKRTASYTVVTSDKHLAKSCEFAGAKTLSLSYFLQKLSRKKFSSIEKERKPEQESSKELKRLQKIFEKLCENNL